MNVEIGTEASQFPEKEYMNGIFVVVHQEGLRLVPYYAIRGALVAGKFQKSSCAGKFKSPAVTLLKDL